MMSSIQMAFAVVWLAWLASWIAAALWSAPTVKRAERLAGRPWDLWAYRAAIFAGAVLLAHAAWAHSREPRLWNAGDYGDSALACATFLGLAFTWWARLHLGRLWSGAITRKQGHQIVDTGPYGLVRHPIYAGLIVALWATAIAQGRASGLAGAALLAFGFWLKARAEERFLIEELGADAYGEYRRRVPMLVPPIWRARTAIRN